jgi:death-on-curing protein
MGIYYFDIAHAINIHDVIIVESGGSSGILNLGLLESTLGHIQNDDYYPSLEDKTTHLFFSICKNHCFTDGNKRSSIALTSYFIEINGFDFRVDRFIKEMENIVVYVADNKINRDLLGLIICSLLYENDYTEDLKLGIIDALSA